MLAALDLTIGYHREKKSRVIVAQEVNICLNSGELICLVGPNGVGKSTLLRSLAGLQPLIGGQIRVHDKRMDKIHPRELAKMIGVVMTGQVNVGAMSAFEVAALGRHPYTNWTGKITHKDELAVIDALQKVDALELAERAFSELSDGERQKILIARALAQEPEILILDEPTAFLDFPRRVMLMQMLQSLAHDWGKSILVSTHDLDLALQSADMIWIMGNDGNIRTGAPEDMVLSGQFEHIFTQQGVRFDTQSGTFRVTTPSDIRVSLEGDDLPFLWTSRALKRAGFEVVGSKEKSQKLVSIILEEGKPAWQLKDNGVTVTYSSIYALIQALIGNMSDRNEVT